MATKTKKSKPAETPKTLLDRRLRPWAVTSGRVVTRQILEIIRDWATGTMNSRQKDVEKRTLQAAAEALKSEADWFVVEPRKYSFQRLNSVTPVTSVEEAEKLGFPEYKVPEFPAKYDPTERVPNQKFTYGQLYAAWRGAFEKMIQAEKDNFPFVADIRAHPDYNVDEGIECVCDDVASMFECVSGMTREIDAMCVDFYFNDNWNNSADCDYFGFHIQGGMIDKDDIVRKYLPKKHSTDDAKFEAFNRDLNTLLTRHHARLGIAVNVITGTRSMCCDVGGKRYVISESESIGGTDSDKED